MGNIEVAVLTRGTRNNNTLLSRQKFFLKEDCESPQSFWSTHPKCKKMFPEIENCYHLSQHNCSCSDFRWQQYLPRNFQSPYPTQLVWYSLMAGTAITQNTPLPPNSWDLIFTGAFYPVTSEEKCHFSPHGSSQKDYLKKAGEEGQYTEQTFGVQRGVGYLLHSMLGFPVCRFYE